MRCLSISFTIALFAASSAFAETCPDASDTSEDIQQLIVEIQAASDEGEARQISGRMWEIWTMAPNEQAQAILDRGMRRRSAYDLAGALEEFDRLAAYCPEYAEGYNQRAFANYLRRDFANALVDLDRAIALSPGHIGAISGRALSLMGLERTDEARIALRQALALNPWLSERALIAPGGPLEPKGQDL